MSLSPVGGLILLLSRSTSHISSGILNFFLYIKNEAGIPMTNGVGASNNCSAQLMHVGSNGIAGNMYSSGYIIVTKAITDIDKAL